MIKVLIADDDDMFLNNIIKPVIRVFLKIDSETELNVITASDGVDAFDKFKKNEPDVVITDYEMPRMNGRELLRKIYGHSYKPQKSFLVSSHAYVEPETGTRFINKDEIFRMFFEFKKGRTTNGSFSY